MKVGFYCWGDPVMGMGHVFRCLALARAARNLNTSLQLEFHLKPGAEGVAAVLAAGEAVNTLPEGELPRGRWDVLVVDQLQVPADQMAALRRNCSCLVSVDDAGPGHWQADLAFSLLYTCRVPRPVKSRTDSRAGYEYMLIDPAFVLLPHPVRGRVEQLFLTQGGSDTWNVLAPLVTGLAPWLAAHPHVTLNVHTGPAFRHEADLEAALARLSTPWRRYQRVPDLAALFGSMDVAVTAAGVTLFELLAAGVPCIVTTAEDKELETAARVAEQGLAVNVGRFGPATGVAVAEALGTVLDHVQRAREIPASRSGLDGRGAERIIRAALDRGRVPIMGEGWR